MREISYNYIGNSMKKQHSIELTKRQVKYAVDKIVSLGLLERKTAHFKSLVGSQWLPDKASYYRLPSPVDKPVDKPVDNSTS